MENNNIEMSFIEATAEELSTIPVVDGQIIAISNGNGFYYDLGGVRRQVSGNGSVSLDSLSADLGELFGTGTGPNLLNPAELELNKQVDTDGTIMDRSINVITTGFIAVEEGKTYYYSRNGVVANDEGNCNGYKMMYNAAYDENYGYIEGSYNEGRCPSITAPTGAKYIRVTFYDTVGRVNEDDGSNNSLNYFVTEGFQLEKGEVTAYKPYGTEIVIIPSVEALEKALEDLTDCVNDNTSARESRWKDKTILWLGTSIPAGKDSALNSEGNDKSYPEMVGERLGANVINMALGSSMIRANVRTGDYVGAEPANILRSLTQTTEEKVSLISDWETIWEKLSENKNASYEVLSEANENEAKEASFETRLLPYLNGTNPMPDLFVIDHGHNDWKYTLSDDTSDILLEPTSSNISSGTLAEDTYMTANDNANLVKYFGDLSNISSTYRNQFIKSVNRNCYIGAVNFICTLILHYNPRARIVFVGNLDNWQKESLAEAQVKVADSWAFPIIKVWEKLGFGAHFIPGTIMFWGEDGTKDLRQKYIYCKDETHPHSDTTGESMQMYADIIADELERCV